MTARALPEDGPSNVPPRDTAALRGALLRFPGGPVNVSSFVEAHPGPTPSSFVEPTREARAVAFLELAREQLSEAQLSGPSARIFLVMSAQGCIDSALGLLR